MTREAAQREFVAAFHSYVRPDDLVDARDAHALKIAALKPREVIDMMEAPDLAAILSGCVGVNAKRNALTVKPDHPVDALINSMLRNAAGRKLCDGILRLLVHAISVPGLRMHLYDPHGHVKKQRAAPAEQPAFKDAPDEEPADLVDMMSGRKSTATPNGETEDA